MFSGSFSKYQPNTRKLVVFAENVFNQKYYVKTNVA